MYSVSPSSFHVAIGILFLPWFYEGRGFFFTVKGSTPDLDEKISYMDKKFSQDIEILKNNQSDMLE
jgi:hypothetical protein